LQHVIQFINGFLIGVANIIPGVSGGTFALVLGIFDRLINSLKSINIQTLRAAFKLLKSGFGRAGRQAAAEELKRIDAGFLCLMAAGALCAIVSCAWLLDYLLAEYPGETLAFFIGLIIPSLAVPYRMMEKRGPAQLFWVLPGAALTVYVALSDISVGGGEAGSLIIFAGGVLAVSAMILPGISGSFCLLILGLYQPTLHHIKAMVHAPTMESVRFIALLGAGICVGFVTFTRVMSFLLSRYRSATLAFLIGLILGSFWVLWPVKDFETSSGSEMKKKIQVATAPNRLPGDHEGDLALCGRLALAALIGLVGAMGINRLGTKNREMDKTGS
jgi:putative membrane protein